MKSRTMVAVLLASLALPAVAFADPITTLSFSGTVTTGYDSSNLFGGGNITGDSYSATVTFDPLKIGADSCGTSTHTTSCNWSASGSSSFAEMLTIIANGQSYSQSLTGTTTSSLSLNSGGNDAIYLSFGGSGFSISLNAVDKNASGFFASDADVNNLDLNFTNVAVNTNSSAEYGNKTSTSFTLGFTTLSASTASAAAVPEPGTLALFGTALLGLGLLRRRAAV